MNGVSGNRFDPQAGAIDHPSQLSGKESERPATDTGKDSKALVSSYSATGSTKAVAEIIADELNANLFEITPVTPYASADLNGNTEGSRVNHAHKNEALCDISPTKTAPANWSEYDIVFIGYPIWWCIAA